MVLKDEQQKEDYIEDINGQDWTIKMKENQIEINNLRKIVNDKENEIRQLKQKYQTVQNKININPK